MTPARISYTGLTASPISRLTPDQGYCVTEPQKLLDSGPAPPHGRYKRQIEGADFSLEAATDAVPDDGQFYVMRKGKADLVTDDFGAAQKRYYELCEAFWMEKLQSDDPNIRIAAAWGLLTLNPTDKTAIGIIQEFGSPQERKRLEQAQSRRRALRARQRR